MWTPVDRISVTPRVKQVREVIEQRLTHFIRARTRAVHPAAIDHISSTLALICSAQRPSLEALSMLLANLWGVVSFGWDPSVGLLEGLLPWLSGNLDAPARAIGCLQPRPCHHVCISIIATMSFS
jgi:hypothetical protein